MRRILLVLAAVLCAPGGHATLVGVAGGSAPPPATLGPYTMTPFPPDPQPLKTWVTSVASPLGGDLLFSEPLYHVSVGQGWAYWSPGYYGGDVYYGQVYQSDDYSLVLPEGTRAFYLYAGHGLFGYHYIQVTAQDGTAITQQVEPASASYYGFYQSDPTGPPLTSLTMHMFLPSVLAIGEFGIAIPEPGAGALGLLAATGAVTTRRRRW